MKIIQGKVGKGIINELIRMFCKDTNPSTLITDQVNLSEIFEKIKMLDKKDILEFSNTEMKNILTNQFVNCDADYYNLIGNINTTSIYINLCFYGVDFKKNIIKFCLQLEREYGQNFVMTEQLPCGSNIEDINIKELGSEDLYE